MTNPAVTPLDDADLDQALGGGVILIPALVRPAEPARDQTQRTAGFRIEHDTNP